MQRRDALRRANDIRIRRAVLKRDISAGRVDAADILVSPPWWCDTMKVWTLLLAIPGCGRVKTDKILRTVRVSPSKTLGGMTARQRREVLRLLAPSPYQVKMAERRAA